MKKIMPISILVLIIDIISKQIILKTVTEGEKIVIIKKFFSITLAKNTGIAFSMLERKIPIIIIVTLFIIFILINDIKNRKIKKIEQFSYALVIGGAIGNLLDRIIYGYVIDFLDFKIFNYDYPIFNLADTFIVIGIILILIINIKEKEASHEYSSRRGNKNRQISNK